MRTPLTVVLYQIKEVKPIRSNAPLKGTSATNEAADAGNPEHLALVIQKMDGTTTLLTLSVDIIGQRTRPFVAQKPASTQPWEFLGWNEKCDGLPLLQKFKGFPLLVSRQKFLCVLQLLHKHSKENVYHALHDAVCNAEADQQIRSYRVKEYLI
jgi:hypothetical protein